jgi:hypothetical protein
MGHQRVGVLALGMLVDELELMSVDAPLEVPVVPEAPMDVPLPVVAPLPVPVVEAELLVLLSVLGVVAAVLGGVDVAGGVVVLDVVEDEVDVSVAVRSPQAARVSAASRAKAAQRAMGVVFIRTLLAVS